jgi:hypothetical protein
MPVSGQDVVIKNLIKYGDGFTKHVNKVMTQVQFILEAKVIENISLRDHSLKDLRSMDHPYATRHGAQGTSPHDPYYQVHKQGGALRSSEKGWTEPADIRSGQLTASAVVKLDAGIAPHAVFVVYGTSKMIPRPVMEGSKDEVLPTVKNLIRDELKNLTANFKGET